MTNLERVLNVATVLLITGCFFNSKPNTISGKDTGMYKFCKHKEFKNRDFAICMQKAARSFSGDKVYKEYESWLRKHLCSDGIIIGRYGANDRFCLRAGSHLYFDGDACSIDYRFSDDSKVTDLNEWKSFVENR